MGLYIWNMVNSFCGVCGGPGGKGMGSLYENSSKGEVFRLFFVILFLQSSNKLV